MEEFNIDPVSQIPMEWLSEAVYSFFPTSKRNYTLSGGYYKCDGPYIDSEGKIFCGSRIENLMLPCLTSFPLNSSIPDIDMMQTWFPNGIIHGVGGYYKCDGPYIDSEGKIFCGSRIENLMLPCLTSFPLNSSIPDIDMMQTWFGPAKGYPSYEIYKDRPVYWNIKQGLPYKTSELEGLYVSLKDSYFNSAAAKDVFQDQIIKNHVQRNGITCSFQKDYDSPAIAQKVEDYITSSIVHTDIVLCVKVRFELNMRNKFLQRLKKSKWPLNLVRDMDTLLTEQGSRWRSKNSPNSKNKYIWLNKNKSGEKSVANVLFKLI